MKGDPTGDSTGLIYDVRPEMKAKRDDKAADAEPALMALLGLGALVGTFAIRCRK